MSDNTARQDLSRRAPITWRIERKGFALATLLALVVMACVFVLEARFFGLEIERTEIAEAPVTLYRTPGAEPAPPVVMAHGFAGSRQMMDQIAVSLARQGFLVASIDLPGHGRNGMQLSPDITNIDGTTAQLVEVVERVAAEVAARPDTSGLVSYVGHSMATDVVIRAAQSRSDVGGVVAISMYSPAVTATEPTALLVLSGATEGHLRRAGLYAVRQLDATAEEGETVIRNGIARRTAVAPWVGHVGVLYAPTSLEEITDWLSDISASAQKAPLDRSGWVTGVLLLGLVLLVWPLTSLIPERKGAEAPAVPSRIFLRCLFLPIPAVLLLALAPIFGIGGHAAFGTLAMIFAAWGVTQLVILHRAGIRPGMPDIYGTIVFLGCALIFAVALDRYGAAFLPTGERLVILLGLLIGTLPFMLADTLLVHHASLLRRLLARLGFLAALSGGMALAPTELGLAFSTVPVLLLFFLVYGTMARWIADRRGASGVAIGKAVVLAWAVAASTPLFAVTSLS